MAKTRKKVSMKRLRSRNRGKVKCKAIKGPNGAPLKLCATGYKYSFSVQLIAANGIALPVHVPKRQVRTAAEALRLGETWVKGVIARQKKGG